MKYIIIAGVIILAAFLAVLSQIPLGIEPLTELYLENHTSLPKNVYLGKTYNFSFTTNNLEYQDVEYEYTIVALDENKNLLFEIDKGKFQLANNESKTINESYKFDRHFKRSQIVIELKKNRIGEPEFKRKLWWENPNDVDIINIHFWVDEIVETQIIIVPD